MDKAILCHLNKMSGGVKSVIGYLQSQLDTLYAKMRVDVNQLTRSRVVPPLSWQQKNNSNNIMLVTKSAKILYFKQPEKRGDKVLKKHADESL